MEISAKQQLFERLDRSLIWDAATLGQAGNINVDAVYGLERLIERHRYLKNEHNFAPGEAEALLCFQQPLTVAQICWNENKFAPSYPICKILNDINAYERFDLTPEERRRRVEPQVRKLQERLNQNLADYIAALMEKSKPELIECCKDFAAIQEAYSYMTESFNYTYGEANLLLQLSNPLGYIASQCLLESDLVGKNGATLEEIVLNLQEPKFLHSIQKAEADVSARSKKPSIREQIQRASQKIGCRPPQKGKSQQKDTPDL